MKWKILGENAMATLGFDPERAREWMADEWARRRAEREDRPKPWSAITPTGSQP